MTTPNKLNRLIVAALRADAPLTPEFRESVAQQIEKQVALLREARDHLHHDAGHVACLGCELETRIDKATA